MSTVKKRYENELEYMIAVADTEPAAPHQGDDPLPPSMEIQACNQLLTMPGVRNSAELTQLLQEDHSDATWKLIGGE